MQTEGFFLIFIPKEEKIVNPVHREINLDKIIQLNIVIISQAMQMELQWNL